MAGVLLWTIDPIKKEPAFLFHKTFDGKKVGMIMDCGGGWKKEDGGDTKFTAAREFCEETMGFLVLSEKEKTQTKEHWLNLVKEVELKNANDEKSYHQHFQNVLDNAIQQAKTHFSNCNEKNLIEIKPWYSTFVSGYSVFIVKSNEMFDLDPLNQLYLKMKRRKEFFWIDFPTLEKEKEKLHIRLKNQPKVMETCFEIYNRWNP